MPRTGLRNFGAVALEEEPRQLRQIVDPIAQRRHPDRDDVDPVVEVLAEPPFLHRLLEIDVGRDDQAEVGLDRLRPPTRSISPSWIARSSFACRSKRRSPISSRNSVPPAASSNLPSCCLCAPVNEPRSWPNSVLSTSSCGIADRLTAMNGASPRPDSRCSSRASSSLPVPLSPRIRTVADSLRDLLHQIDDVADLACSARSGTRARSARRPARSA